MTGLASATKTVIGQTYIIYNNKKALLGTAGGVGYAVADIIASKTTVELQVTSKNVVSFADGTSGILSDNSGATTRVLSSERIQIFISDTVSTQFNYNATLYGDTASDGSPLRSTDSIVMAHEIGHAWGAIIDNFKQRYDGFGALPVARQIRTKKRE